MDGDDKTRIAVLEERLRNLEKAFTEDITRLTTAIEKVAGQIKWAAGIVVGLVITQVVMNLIKTGGLQ